MNLVQWFFPKKQMLPEGTYNVEIKSVKQDKKGIWRLRLKVINKAESKIP